MRSDCIHILSGMQTGSHKKEELHFVIRLFVRDKGAMPPSGHGRSPKGTRRRGEGGESHFTNSAKRCSEFPVKS